MPNLIELAKRHNGDARLPIVEKLLQETALFEDADFRPANSQDSHVYVQRSVLPGGAWTGVNVGLSATGSQTEKKSEAISFYESLSVIDSKILKMADGGQSFKEDEVFAHTTNVSEQISYGFCYGSGVNSLRGISTRTDYDALADAQVVGADGTGSNLTSAYIINWADTYFAYPKNGIGGVDVVELGEGLHYKDDGTAYLADRTVITFGAGLVVSNPRNVARLANIQLDSTSEAYWEHVQYQMVEAVNNLQSMNGNVVIYVNRAAQTVLEKGQLSKGNVYYQPESVGGFRIGNFRGIPVKRNDLISSTETAVS